MHLPPGEHRQTDTSAKINFSYSILFHLTTSYSSYFGGKKGISRNKTSFFLLMQGQWHELLHDKPTGKPYLGEPRDDIHEYDGDSDPSSKSENEADKSDSTSEAELTEDKGKQ